MFTFRFFAVVLLAAVLLSPPVCGAPAKPKPTPVRKTTATAKKPATPAKKPAVPAKKKSKAKPKPAVKKRPPASQPVWPPKPLPTPPPLSPKPAPSPADWTVIISKSGLAEEDEEPPPPPKKTSWWNVFGGSSGPQYKYLTRSVRRAIDNAPVRHARWRYIVVHHSSTRQGNASAFDYYHRNVRKMPNGLAYHFVIGNGTSSGNGRIEIGPRWTRQINGGHVHSDYLNSIALGVCLVGDFSKDKPTKAQLEALDELTRYLRAKAARSAKVKPHRELNPPQRPTDCPGDRFPYGRLRKYD